MRLTVIGEKLWGRKAKFSYLWIASMILIFAFLNAREIWTQEHRWADIVSGMLYRHDFLHPYLDQQIYYDKPLLSYWLIVLLAKLMGGLSTWSLRLPSALSGLLAIGCIYRLGTLLKDRELGLLSGWLLLTTYFFLFWARISSADMLNLAGSLLAVTWYFEKREQGSFFTYTLFFIMIALTSLCKGLVGAAVPFIVIFIDLCLHHSWRRHFQWSLFLALIPGVIIYLLPFWASNFFGGTAANQNGLYLVYRENFIRYFQPFDHQGSLYTYLIYLPLYLLPWTIFFIPALLTLKARWKLISINSKWMAWSLLVLFLFFSLSGSRRSYYVLPVVPFAILFTADWILSPHTFLQSSRHRWTAVVLIFSFMILFLGVDTLPALYYSQFGLNRFVFTLKNQAGKIRPWNEWNIVMLDAESKLNFYLQLPPDTKHYEITMNMVREKQTVASLRKAWPILDNKPDKTIFISRKMHASLLQEFFQTYQMIQVSTEPDFIYSTKHDVNAPIAFIPKQ